LLPSFLRSFPSFLPPVVAPSQGTFVLSLSLAALLFSSLHTTVVYTKLPLNNPR
jgi:hypothetical protein